MTAFSSAEKIRIGVLKSLTFSKSVNFYKRLKHRFLIFVVIPAKAGIQSFKIMDSDFYPPIAD
jgi:hypothetical protein